MEEKKPTTIGGYGAGEWIGAMAIVVIVLLCLASCSSSSDSDSRGSAKADSASLVACKRYAEHQFPYGFEYSTWDTDITEIDGHTRVTFFDAKVGNAYGAQRTVTIHCDAIGDSVINFSAL